MILQTIQSNLSSGYNFRNLSASSEETLIFRILLPRKLSRSESNLIKIHPMQKPAQPESIVKVFWKVMEFEVELDCFSVYRLDNSYGYNYTA